MLTNEQCLENKVSLELNLLVDSIIKKAQQKDLTLQEIDILFSTLNTFIKVTNFIKDSFPQKNRSLYLLEFKKLQIHLLSIIRVSKDAQGNKDTLILSDLLEYELVDNLKQWKILILPTLKHR